MITFNRFRLNAIARFWLANGTECLAGGSLQATIVQINLQAGILENVLRILPTKYAIFDCAIPLSPISTTLPTHSPIRLAHQSGLFRAVAFPCNNASHESPNCMDSQIDRFCYENCVVTDCGSANSRRVCPYSSPHIHPEQRSRFVVFSGCKAFSLTRNALALQNCFDCLKSHLNSPSNCAEPTMAARKNLPSLRLSRYAL